MTADSFHQVSDSVVQTVPGDGGPAFPVQDASTWQGHGMTLRDHFAALALPAYFSDGHSHDNYTGAARWAYATADAMLAARATSTK